MLRAILAAWRTVLGPGRLEPWDYWHAVGAASRRLEPLVPADRLLELNHDYLARARRRSRRRWGSGYDVCPRPGRPPIPVAFTIGHGRLGGRAAGEPGPWTPRPPWVFATYETGGLGNLVELLHESGHALHAAAIRTRPAFLDWTDADTAFLEGDGGRPGLGRHRAGLAAALARRGRRRRARPSSIGTAR